MALSNLTKVQTVGIGSNIEVVGVITTGQFKSGTSNLHSTGVELTNLNVSGIATIGGNLSIGGTLTYQDVTNIDSVGLITARSGINVSGGTATFAGDVFIADKIVHTGDTNTAVRFPAVDTFTVETNNTERFRIGSNGHIGVGNFTSKPRTDPLNVDSGIGTCNIGGNYIHLKRYSGGGTNYITAPQNNANLYISADDHIVFGVDHSSSMYSHGTEAFRIDSSGRLLVGTTTPGHANADEITIGGTGSGARGGITINAHSSLDGSIHFGDGDSNLQGQINYNHSDNTFRFYTQASARLLIDGDGLVTINNNKASGYTAVFNQTHASNPASININSPTDNNLRPSYIQLSQAGTNKWGIGQVYASTSSGAFHIAAGSHSEANSKFTITSAGRIGINALNPDGKATGSLDISSNDSATGRVFTDQRGQSLLTLRNSSTSANSYTQVSFINGGGTQAATLLRHRRGSSHGPLQNFVGDLCLFRRTGNAGGANADYRESTRFCGSNPHARQIWWAYGDNDTAEQSRLGWHHLSAQRDHPGTDAYSFFRLETGAASYARQGWGKYTCAWTTGHASGYGLATGHFGYYMHHNNSRIYVNEHIIYRERYSNGSYYSWDDAPNLRICNSTESGGTNACIVFRCGGRRHSGFDMGVIVGLFIDLYVPETANGDTNPRLYVAGNSQSNLDGGGFGSPVNHDYVSFQSSNPNHGAQP